MKTALILSALAAAFNSALADVLCNSQTLHYKPRIISVAERVGFANTIDKFCGNNHENLLQELFKSAIFSRTCIKGTFSRDECKANFQSIIEACIISKNTGGGSLITNSLTVEIQLDSSNIEVRGLKITEKRKTKNPKVTKPKVTKPKVTKPKGNKTPKPGNKDPKQPKDKTSEKLPAGKTCSLRPGKGNGKGKGKSTNGKKTPTKIIRDLISKLLRRAGESEGKKSSNYGSDCDFEAITDGGAWGTDTWCGFRAVTSNTMMGKTALQTIAKSAYDEIQIIRSRTNIKTRIVVAALFIPNKGVYLGTPAHGSGEQKVKEFAPVSAPQMWKSLKTREIKKNRCSSLYNVEKIAILLATEREPIVGVLEIFSSHTHFGKSLLPSILELRYIGRQP